MSSFDRSIGQPLPRNLVRYFGSGYLETIKNLELRVSNVLDHNDPFESEFPTGGELTMDNVRQLFMSRQHQWDSLFLKIQKKYPNLKTRKSLERHFLGSIDIYAKNYIDAVESTRAKMVKVGRGVLNRALRVVCFTRVKDEPESMKFWAHYANNSAGARIHFEIPERELINLKKINYVPSRPVIDLTMDPQSPAGHARFHELLTTKDEIWKAEDELRLFVHPERCVTKNIKGKDMDFMKIGPEWITMVDVGHKADAEVTKQLVNYVKELGYSITVRRARLPADGSRSFSYEVLHAAT